MKHNACDPVDATTFHEELAGVGVGDAGGSHLPLLKMNKEQDLTPGHQGMRWLDGITSAMNTDLGKLQGGLVCCSPCGSQRVGHD